MPPSPSFRWQKEDRTWNCLATTQLSPQGRKCGYIWLSAKTDPGSLPRGLVAKTYIPTFGNRVYEGSTFLNVEIEPSKKRIEEEAAAMLPEIERKEAASEKRWDREKKQKQEFEALARDLRVQALLRRHPHPFEWRARKGETFWDYLRWALSGSFGTQKRIVAEAKKLLGLASPARPKHRHDLACLDQAGNIACR